MPRYYFDLRDGDELARDKDGVELPNITRVQEEAAKALADLAREAVRFPKLNRSKNHRMAIEVRNETGRVLEMKCTVEVARSDPS
jgi:hypothetical protein